MVTHLRGVLGRNQCSGWFSHLCSSLLTEEISKFAYIISGFCIVFVPMHFVCWLQLRVMTTFSHNGATCWNLKGRNLKWRVIDFLLQIRSSCPTGHKAFYITADCLNSSQPPAVTSRNSHMLFSSFVVFNQAHCCLRPQSHFHCRRWNSLGLSYLILFFFICWNYIITITILWHKLHRLKIRRKIIFICSLATYYKSIYYFSKSYISFNNSVF